jgi:hypothetical protein
VRLDASGPNNLRAASREGWQTTYTGDLLKSQVWFEHMTSDKRGLGYRPKLSTLQRLTWRANDAICPNLSIIYFWGQIGKLLMR